MLAARLSLTLGVVAAAVGFVTYEQADMETSLGNPRQSSMRSGAPSPSSSRLVGVSRKTINTIETGRFVPSTIVALRMAHALGMSVEDLFFLEDDAGPRLTPR